MPRREIIVRNLHKALDMHRVASDKVTSKLVHMGHDLLVSIRLCIAFSPPVEALVGVDLHETEVFGFTRMHEKIWPHTTTLSGCRGQLRFHPGFFHAHCLPLNV